MFLWSCEIQRASRSDGYRIVTADHLAPRYELESHLNDEFEGGITDGCDLQEKHITFGSIDIRSAPYVPV